MTYEFFDLLQQSHQHTYFSSLPSTDSHSRYNWDAAVLIKTKNIHFMSVVAPLRLPVAMFEKKREITEWIQIKHVSLKR